MSNVVVSINNISKKYKSLGGANSVASSVLSKNKNKEVWALRKITANIKKGEEFGIVGLNGAGKTTLLKIIAGITTPYSGSLKTIGKVVSLINLNAGIQPDLDGKENIFLNGMLLGSHKDEIRKNLSKIIRFADIGKFIDAPLFTYSDGMKLRLGFSVAVHVNPDILVIDESFGYGDKEFTSKAINKLGELVKKGTTIIHATHNLEMLERVYQKVIWIEKGELKDIGVAKKVINKYRRFNPQF